MSDIVEQLKEPEEHYPGNFDTPKRANAMLSCLCQEAAEEIESLRQKLEMAEACLAGDNALIVGLKNDIAEKDAEIARRVTVDEMNAEIECATKAVAVYYENMLSASQSREQQLLEALEKPSLYVAHNGDDWVQLRAKEALALPTDTTAMQAMIAKAGEVMREEVIEQCVAIGIMSRDGRFVEEIRAIPIVTLDDLK